MTENRPLLHDGSHHRWLAIAGAFIALVCLRGEAQQTIPLTQGMVIERSMIVSPGTYQLEGSADLKTPAITIRGQNITVDFSGATLVGSPSTADPDEFAGVAVLVDGGRHVTIRGAAIRGYKVGILARNSPDLRITRSDLSYNWKQRLQSRIEKESLVDWMSYHQNDTDEWLRYGAAIYLSRCDRAEIDQNTVVQGQNALMVSASNKLNIWNNTFQFLSSIGVGLYRVTDSTIMHNRIDWCVRGYSHGFYNRGQDSAGLLMYEQSSKNTVAYNSVTHSGDGLFLWAGQSTMDTGQGGANDNLFYRNDFSHAPTNGIEATFSRNRFIDNRVEDNWHGVWGGYSYGSVWSANRFARNAEAIAIEHGQDNEISKNTFDGDVTAIRLWQNASQDPNWGYPKARDTSSRGYRIEQNTFRGTKTAVDVRDTRQVRLWSNTYTGVSERLKQAGTTTGLTEASDPPEVIAIHFENMPATLVGGMDAMLPDGARRGRDTIVVDEWGPYDWKSPKLWPVLNANPARPLPYRLDAVDAAVRKALPEGATRGEAVRLNVLGPAGTWRLLSARGASASPERGKVGDVVTVTPRIVSGTAIDYEIALEYRGAAVISPRGVRTAAGTPYTFGFSHFHVPVDWKVRFFEYSDQADPVKQPEAFEKLLSGEPVKTVMLDRLDYLSGGSLEERVPRDRFALVAEGTANLPAGDYTIQTISDDGVRVWVDEQLLIDAWDPHESRIDQARLAGGTHRIKVHYYEATGWAEVKLTIQPRRTKK